VDRGASTRERTYTVHTKSLCDGVYKIKKNYSTVDYGPAQSN